MLGLWNLNWLNHNSQRAYPLAEWSTRQCYEGSSILLPNDFLLALRISINTGHNVQIDKFFIKSVIVSSTNATVTIGYYDGSASPADCPSVAKANISTSSEQGTYTLIGLGDFDDAVGYIAINTNSQIFQQITGKFLFAYEATAIEPDCIIPMLRSVSALSLSGYNRVYGDIQFIAGSNVIMSASVSGGTSSVTISVDPTEAIESYTQQCACNTYADRKPIYTINGVGPDSRGSFHLTGSACAEFTQTTNGLRLTDTCAQPDCGCDELEALATSLRQLETGAHTLNIFLEQMYASIQQSTNMVMASADYCACATEEVTDA